MLFRRIQDRETHLPDMDLPHPLSQRHPENGMFLCLERRPEDDADKRAHGPTFETRRHAVDGHRAWWVYRD